MNQALTYFCCPRLSGRATGGAIPVTKGGSRRVRGEPGAAETRNGVADAGDRVREDEFVNSQDPTSFWVPDVFWGALTSISCPSLRKFKCSPLYCCSLGHTPAFKQTLQIFNHLTLH